MDDLPHHTLDVVVALSRVQHTVLGCTLAVGVVGLEHRSPTLTLGPDNATHLQDNENDSAVKRVECKSNSRQHPSDSSKLLQGPSYRAWPSCSSFTVQGSMF
jgi:hypothetical protein